MKKTFYLLPLLLINTLAYSMEGNHSASPFHGKNSSMLNQHLNNVNEENEKLNAVIERRKFSPAEDEENMRAYYTILYGEVNEYLKTYFNNKSNRNNIVALLNYEIRKLIVLSYNDKNKDIEYRIKDMQYCITHILDENRFIEEIILNHKRHSIISLESSSDRFEYTNNVIARLMSHKESQDNRFNHDNRIKETFDFLLANTDSYQPSSSDDERNQNSDTEPLIMPQACHASPDISASTPSLSSNQIAQHSKTREQTDCPQPKMSNHNSAAPLIESIIKRVKKEQQLLETITATISSLSLSPHIDLDTNISFLQKSITKTQKKLTTLNAAITKTSRKKRFFNLFSSCTGFSIAALGLYNIYKNSNTAYERSIHNPLLLVTAGAGVGISSLTQLFSKN